MVLNKMCLLSNSLIKGNDSLSRRAKRKFPSILSWSISWMWDFFYFKGALFERLTCMVIFQ